MEENRPAPKKRKMPLKQRAAIAIVRMVDKQEQKKAQKTDRPQQGKAAASSRAPANAPRRQSGQAPAQQRPRTAAEAQRAKRAAYLRRQNRRRKNIRIAIAALAALIVLLILSRTVLFKIQNIEVTNPKDANYTSEQIVSKSGVVYGTKNLFSCDLEKVARNIEQGLPYIGKAEVKRDFPNSLQVTVTPTRAAAAMAYGTGYLLIDADGKMLETLETAPDGIPVLRCETEFELNLGQYIGVSTAGRKPDDKTKAAASMIELFKEINDAIKNAQLTEITLIDIRDERAITLMYQNRLTLHLGGPDQLEQKLLTGAKIIAVESDSSQSRIGAIDLTMLPKGYSRDTFEMTTSEGGSEPESATEVREG